MNGKRYDAHTGHIITGSETKPVQNKKTVSSSQPGQVLDGFVRRAPSKLSPNHYQRPAEPPVTAKPVSSSTTVKQAARKLAKSNTLMRPAVKKPTDLKNDVVPPKHVAKPSHAQSARLARASYAAKSPLISRFARAATQPLTKKEAHLPVITPAKPSVSHTPKSELQKLEHVLQDATAHLHTFEENILKKNHLLNRVGFKNKFANITALFCAVLLLVGFFGYQNAASISMKVAASRSGIDAKLPDYKPAGYGINGGVKSQAGKVSVSFKSRTDTKNFTITQESSNWNSTSLLANHVTKTRCNTCYQTWQNDGKTVYIYDSSNATWVNGGIWYTVEGNADLTSDQLLRLANSL